MIIGVFILIIPLALAVMASWLFVRRPIPMPRWRRIISGFAIGGVVLGNCWFWLYNFVLPAGWPGHNISDIFLYSPALWINRVSFLVALCMPVLALFGKGMQRPIVFLSGIGVALLWIAVGVLGTFSNVRQCP